MIYAASIRRLGVIKIGHTLYPRDRICSLRRQYGQKVRYIALAEGSMNQERILHESLWQHCIGAELYPSGVAAIRRAVAAIRVIMDQFSHLVDTKGEPLITERMIRALGKSWRNR